MSKNVRLWLGILLILAGAVFVAHYYWPAGSKPISRGELRELMDHGQILKARVEPTPYAGIYTVAGTVRRNGSDASFSVTTHLDESQIKQLFQMQNVSIDLPEKSSKTMWVNLLSSLAIGGAILAVLAFQLNLGKGKSAHRVKQRPTTRLTDVAGIEEAKAEVSEIVDFLKDPDKYRQLGGKLPKGVLLIGPPGTGKTMLAKAIAGEASANFFSAHGSDFNEVYVGVGARRVRELFRQAARNKPAIIFIDEIDCLGKNRKHDTNGELQQTNNALLAAMDGFEGSEGIVVLAATNRPEDLDEALVRPGRFDRKVHVPCPDLTGRRAILLTHTRNKPILDPESAIEIMARTTPGMSGADLANLVNEAAILCAQKNLAQITLRELEESRDKIRFGKERRSLVVKDSEREIVAYHEAGHAMIMLQSHLLPPLYKVSVVPRGSALGVTTLLPNEDQHLQSRGFLLQELLVLMGGRAAERTFFGSTTNGANGDLDTAKRIAQKMIHDWGMGEKLYYQADRSEAELEINRLLETADAEALAVIQSKKAETEKLARALLERETLTREEVLELLEGETTATAA